MQGLDQLYFTNPDNHAVSLARSSLHPRLPRWSLFRETRLKNVRQSCIIHQKTRADISSFLCHTGIVVKVSVVLLGVIFRMSFYLLFFFSHFQTLLMSPKVYFKMNLGHSREVCHRKFHKKLYRYTFGLSNC